MAQFQLELDALELQTKHQRLQAKADILESYSTDERDAINNALDNHSRVQTHYLNPALRSCDQSQNCIENRCMEVLSLCLHFLFIFLYILLTNTFCQP